MAPKVWWSYSFEANGVRTKSVERFESWGLLLFAMGNAATRGRTNFRIRKITITPKAKVVARLSDTGIVRGFANGHHVHGARLGDQVEFLKSRIGKRVRITLEELADEGGA